MNKKSASVKLDSVTKKYGAVTAVNDLTLNVKAGELVTLLGPSGCGKTTMLRMIAGLEEVTRGNIRFDDKEVTDQSATYRNVAMVFQSYALFPHMSVLDNVSYGLSVSNIEKKKIKAKALAGLAMVGLTGYESRMPSELSGGQQQRVAVARAVVLEPEVLLFDEPLSNLDAKLRRHVREEIRQIQQELGLTAVYVTHDQEEAMAVSDKIVVMQNGTIAQAGSPSDLYESPDSEFIADFIGNANVIPCQTVSVNKNTATVSVDEVLITSKAAMDISAALKLVVHPQNIVVSIEAGAMALKGTIQHVAYLGSHIEYEIKTLAATLFVIDNQMRARFRKGDSVFAHLPEDKTSLVPA